MTGEKCLRCNGKGKSGLFGRKCDWCKGTGVFVPGPCPKCKGSGKVKESFQSFDAEDAKPISVGVRTMGMVACTKCDGTGQSINRAHVLLGDK